jgi:dihydroorotate dehydrogenase (fumarate)
MTQSLRWITILSQKISCDLSASTGIHDYKGIVKQLLAGAATTQICTALFKFGIGYIDTMLNNLKDWMKEHNFETIDEFKGMISNNTENRVEFERVQFLKRNE